MVVVSYSGWLAIIQNISLPIRLYWYIFRTIVVQYVEAAADTSEVAQLPSKQFYTMCVHFDWSMKLRGMQQKSEVVVLIRIARNPKNVFIGALFLLL